MKIYRLLSDGCVRYIGKTNQSLEKRLKGHLKAARQPGDTLRLRWLRSLRLPPTIELVSEVLGRGNREEIYQIALARAYGCNLVNADDGGDGGIGRKVSLETRQTLSKQRKGVKKSRTHVHNQAEAYRGRKSKNSSSSFIGVFRVVRRGKVYWMALVTQFRKRFNIGVFKNELEAARAVDTFVRANSLSPKLLNFP